MREYFILFYMAQAHTHTRTHTHTQEMAMKICATAAKKIRKNSRKVAWLNDFWLIFLYSRFTVKIVD